MTFLQFVCRKLLGKPAAGQSSWQCPRCESDGPSFHVRPPKRQFKIRFRCFRCGWWGDAKDLSAHFFPEDSDSAHDHRVATWRTQYEQSPDSAPADESFLFRGRGITENIPKQPANDRRDVGLAWANLMSTFEDEETSEIFALQVLREAQQECRACNVTMESLVGYWLEFNDGQDEMLQKHVATCEDWDCGNQCRTARGLPPLTEAERETRRAEEEAEQQRKELIRENMKRMGNKKKIIKKTKKKSLSDISRGTAKRKYDGKASKGSNERNSPRLRTPAGKTGNRS